MKFQLKHLKPRHYRVLELCREGKQYKVIARKIGLTPRSISNIINSPIFQDELARRREERNRRIDYNHARVAAMVRNRITQAAVAAAEAEVKLLDSENKRVVLRAAEKILDTVGIGRI